MADEDESKPVKSESEGGSPGVKTSHSEGLKKQLVMADRVLSIIDHICPPRHQNVLTEFADSREFLLSGDAVVLEMLGDINYDTSCGGQFLHFIYLCERFLLNFIQKGGVICVVFFEDMCRLWARDPSALLARESLRLHLSRCSGGVGSVRVLTTDNPWSEEFLAYVRDMSPTYAVTTDSLVTDHLADPALERPVGGMFAIIRAMFLSHQLNLSFIAGIQFQANAFQAFYVPSGVQVARIVAKHTEYIKSLWTWLISRKSPTEQPLMDLKRCLEARLCHDWADLTSVRSVVAGLAAGQLLSQSQQEPLNCPQEATLGFCQLFVLHAVLMSHTPLRTRSQLSDGEIWAKSGYRALSQMQTVMARLLPVAVSCEPPLDSSPTPRWVSSLSRDIADVMDGRFLTRLLQLAHHQPQLFTECGLGEEVSEHYCAVWQSVVQSCLSEGLTVEAFPIQGLNMLAGSEAEPSVLDAECLHDNPTKSPVQKSPAKLQLLPIDCPLVHELVGDLQQKLPIADISRREVRGIVKSGRNFDERYHWHSKKLLLDDYEMDNLGRREDLSNLTNWQLTRKLRGIQKLKSFERWYGDTLGGGESMVIPSCSQTTQAKGTKQKAIQQSAKHKLSKADTIRQENQSSLEERELKKATAQWQKCVSELRACEAREDKQLMLSEIERFLESCRVEDVKYKARLRKLDLLWSLWSQKSNRERELDPSIAIQLMVTIQNICRHSELLARDIRTREHVAGVLDRLGFLDLAQSIHPHYTSSGTTSSAAVPMSSTRFQLIHMSHLLERDLRTDRDPRVHSFIPDTWQRELLDVIDHGQSALIVAPTSSGKTYVSYYCMERVLRESNDGVVVYVAPTKALVNQVAATVYARFQKMMPAGRTVFGVFTRDYHNDILECQVLVTVPQCLEILLLSPRRQGWVSKLKYVIFDEVHCLGVENNGEVWEHILMLIRCPFIALSATIQNPGAIQSWLQKGSDILFEQDTKSNTLRSGGAEAYKVRLVTYSERYADLEKYIYFPDVDEDSRTNGEFVSFHPILSLTRDKIKEMTEFPGSLDFSAKECIELFDAMYKIWPERHSLERYVPESYFGSQLFPKRSKAKVYERDLKSELMDWKREGHLDKIDAVVSEIGARFNETYESVMESYLVNSEDDSSLRFIAEHIPQLMEKLKQENKLPALIFSFNRSLCKDMVKLVVDSLTEKEDGLKRLPEVHRFLDQLDKISDLTQDMNKNLEKGTTKKIRPKLTDTAQGSKMAALTIATQDLEDARLKASRAITVHLAKLYKVPHSEVHVVLDVNSSSDPLPHCSYRIKGSGFFEDKEKVSHRLRFEYNQTEVLECFERGMMWHHAGNNNKVRSTTEVLFRKQHLQAIMATSTLALGIHMPCKSVVFAGDSPYLDSLMFRQMSGRSGRRGFDQLGHVYFFGLPLKKVRHLVSSKLSNIHGNFPVTVSLVLRLFLLCASSKNKQLALNMSMALMENSLMTMEQPILNEQIRQYFMYTTQFLLRQGLLNEKGQPQGLAGLVTHLYYHEPANLVFVHMLTEGAFHKLCTNTGPDGKFSNDVMMDLVNVLAHLFGRIYIRKKSHVEKLKQDSKNSKIVLPPMPPNFVAVQSSYNASVARTFNEYMQTAAEIVRRQFPEERELPLSGVDFGSDGGLEGGLAHSLTRSCLQSKVCSVFAALSGHTDANLWQENSNFNNIRPGLYCEEDVMPILPVESCDRLGNPMALSGYMLDFFRHGSKASLENDFKIRSSDVYQTLKDAVLTIKAITASLEQMRPDQTEGSSPRPDRVVQAFRQLRDQYHNRFKDAFKHELWS